jgi:hypothetical protein
MGEVNNLPTFKCGREQLSHSLVVKREKKMSAKNGYWLKADQADAALTIRALAAGDLTEDQLATWIGEHMVARPT